LPGSFGQVVQNLQRYDSTPEHQVDKMSSGISAPRRMS